MALQARAKLGYWICRGTWWDIVGEHDVLFAGPGERIVLRHVQQIAHCLRGAVRAAFGHLHSRRANIRC